MPAEGGLYASLTIDSMGAGDGAQLQRLLTWLGERDVRATFFLIPYNYSMRSTLVEDPELMAAVRRGLDEGHDFQQHGYEHELFECGIPEPMAIRDDAMQQRLARTMSREMFQLIHQHTRGKIGTMLGRGLRIMTAALGEDHAPTGFRSGYHAFSRAMYFALEDLKLRWTSTRTAVPAAWRRVLEPGSEEIVSWVGLLPYWVGDVLEIPHLANYGYRLTPATMDDWLGLAGRHLGACAEAGAPFIPVASYGGLRGDERDDLGFRAYEEIIDRARGEHGAQWVTLRTIADVALAKPKAWQTRDEFRR